MTGTNTSPFQPAVRTLTVLLASVATIAAANVGPEVTYQGRLLFNDGPADGFYDMEFTLYGAAAGGAAVAPPVQFAGANTLLVKNGLFTATLDFGAGVFNGQARWLEISVRPSGAGTYQTLSPRQPITAAPYALYALDAAGGSTSPWQVDGADIYYAAGNVGIGIADSQSKLHLRTKALALDPAALENDEIIVEAQDAVIGLYSEPQGNWASALALKEVTNGQIVDTWGIARRTSTVGSDLRFTYGNSNNYASNASLLVLRTDGAVGIGTESPDATLSINGTSGNTLELLRSSGGFAQTRARFGISSNGAGQGLRVQMSADGGATGSDALFIGADTRTGIGTTTPAERLHVAGAGRFDGDLHVTNGTREVLIENNALRMYDSTGNRVFNMYSNAIGGGSEAFWANGDGDETIEVDPDESGAGVIRLSNAAGTATIELDASDSGGAGRIVADVVQINGADLSEQFDVNADQPVVPGMVVCIDPAAPGALTIATEAYDKKVAGIVSGAGGVRTGLLMGQKDTLAHGDHAVALTGRVWCCADARYGAIQPGDQLTTSPTAGHAMKASDLGRAHGAIIGKAMTGLADGHGMVLVLVQPQ